eukprot:4990508-Prymnesium_polylepis.1
MSLNKTRKKRIISNTARAHHHRRDNKRPDVPASLSCGVWRAEPSPTAAHARGHGAVGRRVAPRATHTAQRLDARF